MRRARVDDNQRQIVAALRKAGASVQHLHAVGQGCPDILVGHVCPETGRRVNTLLELKDGSKPPSARGLTDAQLRWHSLWMGQVAIAEDELQALRIIGAIE
jgi:hypothetical protein